MIIANDDIEFTGERFVPGKALGQIEVEHLHRYQAVLEIIRNKKVLDAACGTGYGSALMSSVAQNVTGIDISGDTISHNQKIYADIKNLEFIEASIAELPFPDKSFDVIVSFETIEHVNEELQNSFLREIQRCLKDDGILIMSSPDKRTYTDLTGLTNEFHVKEFYYDEFLNFLEKAFKYKKIYVQGEHELSGELITSYPYISEEKIKILNNPYLNNDKNLYIIAVCSNKALSDDISLSTLYPNVVSPRAFLFSDGQYTDKTMLIPEQFTQKNGVVSAYFNLKGKTTEGKIRFDPMENFACQVKIIDIDTDANDVNITGLNEREKIDNSYIFVDTDPNMEITGDFSSATYIKLNYHISILSVTQIMNYLTNDLQEKETQLNIKEERIGKLTLDYNAVKCEAQHYKNDLDAVTKQFIQTKNELTEQLIQTQKQLTDYHNTLLYKITMKIKKIFN